MGLLLGAAAAAAAGGAWGGWPGSAQAALWQLARADREYHRKRGELAAAEAARQGRLEALGRAQRAEGRQGRGRGAGGVEEGDLVGDAAGEGGGARSAKP